MEHKLVNMKSGDTVTIQHPTLGMFLDIESIKKNNHIEIEVIIRQSATEDHLKVINSLEDIAFVPVSFSITTVVE